MYKLWRVRKCRLLRREPAEEEDVAGQLISIIYMPKHDSNQETDATGRKVFTAIDGEQIKFWALTPNAVPW